jgi:hypothetical protein
MLLTQRRVALLHVCLTAMQAGWITPFVLLLYPHTATPWSVFALVLGVLLSWMLTLELLSRRFESPAYDGISLLLMFGTSLLLVRLLLYRAGPWDMDWLAQAVRDTIEFDAGLPPVLVVLGANLLLWQRATAATSQDLSFFGVGVTFRMGMLLLFAGGGAYAVARGVELTGFLWVYFAAGLAGVSLARIGEKAVDAQSAGAVLPAQRLSQVLAAVGVTLGLAMVASLAYTPEGVRRFLRLFTPLWELVRPLLLALLITFGRLLEPLALWLEGVITRMLRARAFGEEAGPAPLPGNAPNPLANLPAWPFELLQSGLIILMLIGTVLGLLVFLLVYLERVRRERARVEGEEEDRDPGSFGGGIFGRGLTALRDAIRLSRRLGIGRQLLAAISVQNIYANLARIAGQHGRSRRPAQPPDDYLPVLASVFPGQDAALVRITNAYMRVHYGDHPVGTDELAALREDYRAVRAAEVERS